MFDERIRELRHSLGINQVEFGKRLNVTKQCISNWENNWEDVSSFFQFSGDIRRIMYTTNIIEGLNRQYRKVTKTKSVFPSDTALEKMLFLASRNVTKKWTQRYRNWDQVLNQLILLYDERLTAYL